MQRNRLPTCTAEETLGRWLLLKGSNFQKWVSIVEYAASISVGGKKMISQNSPWQKCSTTVNIVYSSTTTHLWTKNYYSLPILSTTIIATACDVRNNHNYNAHTWHHSLNLLLMYIDISSSQVADVAMQTNLLLHLSVLTIELKQCGHPFLYRI